MSVYYGRRRIIVVRPSGIVAALPATSYKLGQVNGVTWGSWHTVSMSIYISVYNQLVPELIYTKLASKNKWSIYADSSLARTHALSRGYLISFFHFCEKKLIYFEEDKIQSTDGINNILNRSHLV